MDSFKLWIISVCGATAVTSVFKLLLSNSSLKKALNIFFSLFILFYTVIPMGNFFSDKAFSFEDGENAFEYEEFYQKGYEKLVKEAIINTCEKLSVTVLSVDIDSYIDDEGYLNIQSLAITTDSPERKTEIEERLKKELGFEVNVS